jgi:hypothetical protein
MPFSNAAVDYSTSAGWLRLASGELHSGRMPKKLKKKRFRAVKAVKALARERIGSPPPEKVVPDRKKEQKRNEKHKPTLGRLLGPEE